MEQAQAREKALDTQRLFPLSSGHESRRAEPTDLRAWRAMLDHSAEQNSRAAQGIHIGLIYCADYDEDGSGSWALPVCHGWVTYRTGYNRKPVTDKLEIQGRA